MDAKKRPTLKDLAELAGVSTVTVHKALYGKGGPAPATREKILRLARESGYRINSAASALKRRTVRITVLLNEGTGEDRFFYPSLWKGLAEAEETFKDFNVEVRKLSFSGDHREQLRRLEALLREGRAGMDGLATTAWHAVELNPVLEAFGEAGLPVVLFNADAEGGRRVGYVGAPARAVGLLAGELMSGFIAPGGRVLVLGGNRMLRNHRETAFGFYSELKARRPETEILELYDFYDREKLAANLAELLASLPDVRGVYCTNARNTLAMCELLKSSSRSGSLKTIGSDVFEELRPYFEDGTLMAVVWQNPKLQAYKAVETLYRHIMKQPHAEEDFVGIGLVMKNNFDYYV